MSNIQQEKYMNAFSSYIAKHISFEDYNDKQLKGWYHYFTKIPNRVGVVATSQVLILIQEGSIPIHFKCNEMIESIITLQKEDGGWGYRSNIPESSIDPTCWVIRALLLWHGQVDGLENSIMRGLSWLLDKQNSTGFWAPIGNNEETGYIYFSCVALQCLAQVLPILQESALKAKVQQSISKCCSALFNSFIDKENQCGWGRTVNDDPTLFHSSFVVYTLMSINKQNAKQYEIAKTLEQLKGAIVIKNGTIEIKRELNEGMKEFYQMGSRRLSYVHSVDVYVALALTFDDYIFNPDFKQICGRIIQYANGCNWEYDEYTTCWRMFDVVNFCNLYYKRIQNCERKQAMRTTDILIMVATEDEEKAIVKNSEWSQQRTESGDVFYTCERNETSFALARGYGMGEAATVQLAQAMIYYCKPKVITMAGFCAGNSGKVKLGDLIVANKVYNYERGKQIGEGFVLPEIENYNLDPKWQRHIELFKDSFVFPSKIDRKPRDFDIQCLELLDDVESKGKRKVEQIQDEKKYPDWTEVMKKLKDEGCISLDCDFIQLTDTGKDKIHEYKALYININEEKPRVHIGPIATGSRVVEWNKVFDYLEITHERKTSGLDMESHSIGFIADTNELKFLVVKGVGDYAKGGKAFANRYIEYTSYASCEFIMQLFSDKGFKSCWNK